jgi:hypothetical protein
MRRVRSTLRQIPYLNNQPLGWLIISKKKHTLQFREDPPDSLPNKENIYQNYFNKEGNYICVQDS